jgi:hypothetical protein
MILPFDSITLLRAIEKASAPASTPILTRHFADAGVVPTETVQVDIITGPEGLMVAISRDAESNIASREVVDSKTFNIPRFSEKFSVTPSDVVLYRQPGTINGMSGLAQLVGRRLRNLMNKLNSTKEVMAIRALQGQVSDGAGNVIATYPVGDDGSVNFTTTNPRVYFDNAAVTVSRALRTDNVRLICYVGKTAYQKLLLHADVQALLAGPMGPSMLENGVLSMLHGVEIRRINGAYTNNAGSETPYLADNAMITTAIGPYFEQYHGPCSTVNGVALQQMFVDTWETRDPPTSWTRLESNPLPIVQRPEAVRKATVA